MAYKLKASQQTEEILTRLEASENLPWPTLAKLAISLSIRQGPLMELELYTDNRGREVNRQTVTGEADVLYKCLMELQQDRFLPDEEYFPTYVKGHLDRGAELLEREKRYARDLWVHLTKMEEGI